MFLWYSNLRQGASLLLESFAGLSRKYNAFSVKILYRILILQTCQYSVFMIFMCMYKKIDLSAIAICKVKHSISTLRKKTPAIDYHGDLRLPISFI